MILLGIVDEDLDGETSGTGVVSLVAAFAQTADIVHAQLRHGFDASAIGEISVGQHLSRLAAGALGDALDRRR